MKQFQTENLAKIFHLLEYDESFDQHLSTTIVKIAEKLGFWPSCWDKRELDMGTLNTLLRGSQLEQGLFG